MGGQYTKALYTRQSDTTLSSNFEQVLLNNFISDRDIIGCVSNLSVGPLINKYPEFYFNKTGKCINGIQLEARRLSYLGDLNKCCTQIVSEGTNYYIENGVYFTCDPYSLNPAKYSTCDYILFSTCFNPITESNHYCELWMSGLLTRPQYKSQIDIVNNQLYSYCNTKLGISNICKVWIKSLKALHDPFYDNIVNDVIVEFCNNVDATKCKCLLPVNIIKELEKKTSVDQVCWNRDCVFGDRTFMTTDIINRMKKCVISNCIVKVDEVNNTNTLNNIKLNITNSCTGTFADSINNSNISIRDSILNNNTDIQYHLQHVSIYILIISLFIFILLMYTSRSGNSTNIKTIRVPLTKTK